MRKAVYLCLVLGGIIGCTPAFEEGNDCTNGVDDDDDGLADCDDPNCQLLAACGLCGNGDKDPGEVCDDGNLVDGDGCSSHCLGEKCPNGELDDGEACDDGNNVPGDGCDASCSIDRCGDRVLERDIEQCEDGNRDDGDGCDHDCRAEPVLHCGNFQIEFDPQTGQQLEECDDGNNTSGDGCSSSCRFERCGDGLTQPTLNEQCDDGDPFKPAACVGCRIPACGDFFTSANEQCDDGNQRSGDGCNSECRGEFCGDGIVTGIFGEQCDDGNTVDGDGCSRFCAFD